MKTTGWILSILLLASGLKAQDKRVLLTVEEDQVTVEEFLNIYNKNNTSNVVDKKSLEEYLELFINFKLKVKEAESMGMDTAKSFEAELAGYRKQLAQPYLLDKKMNESLVREAYERLNEDVSAYHILIMVPEGAPAVDSVKAKKQLEAIQKRVKNEADFLAEMQVIKNDNNDKTIAEDLGYFTAFSMVYPFETAAYSTPVGRVSKLVRTRFGYHVIFVKDRRAARGEIRVAHIMLKANDDMTPEQQETAKNKIDEIYKRLKQDEDFALLAKEYSEDKGTASKGGMLPWFGTGRMVESFENAAFDLKDNGDISEPVRTNYGWHIIRREDYKSIQPFEELEASLKKRIERDSRGQKGRASLLKQLKQSYTLVLNRKKAEAAEATVNKEFLNAKWKPTPSGLKMDETVVEVVDPSRDNLKMSFSQSDYLRFLAKNQRKKGENAVLSSVIAEQWEAFIDDCVIAFENENLESKYPEFKALMQEYHDGILLFDLMDQKVWSKAVKDSAGLKVFYEQNRDQFMWPDRVAGAIYSITNKDDVKKVVKMLKKREKKGYIDEQIAAKFNIENPLNVTFKRGLFSKEDNEFVAQIEWVEGVSKTFEKEGKTVIVDVRQIVPSTNKTLDEARGVITSSYQNQLEEAWIAELREKFDYKVNTLVFKSIQAE